MNLSPVMVAAMALLASASTDAQTLGTSQPQSTTRPSGPLQQKIAPGLAALTDEVLFGADSDEARAKAATDQLGTVAPKFVQLTNDVVFDNLWRRSDLTLRDWSLITIAALAAMGDDDQLDFCLRRGVESGLTRAQITEALAHLGFYAGWRKRPRP